MIIEEDNYLAHYGILRKSGRYPWGSGGPEYATNDSFLGYVDKLQKDGLSMTEIAKAFGTTTTQLRDAKTVALNEQKHSKIIQAQTLKEKGYSNVAIGKRMGINESSVRSLLAPAQQDRNEVLRATADMLKTEVEKRGFIDVGSGVENHLGISADKLRTAVSILKEDGYKLHYVKVPQLGTTHETTLKVLSKPDVPWTSDIAAKVQQIGPIGRYSEDGGHNFLGLKDPINIPTSRVHVRYGKDGGAKADGVIYVRPGVPDIDLGAARYAQVRISVNGTHYLKGMAMYKDDLPKGVDLMFNTNKENTGNPLDAMKALKEDKDNPFGAVVRQLHDEHGNVRSAMNIVNDEGRWDNWSRSLSSQFLSKQSPKLAQEQLAVTHERKKQELDEIMKLTNPAVRRKLLQSYADDTDASAVHLKAAALPRQATKVILPLSSSKADEIYAPSFRDGERVALVRFPHGGKFEIPELTVNNRNPEGKKLLGSDAKDAIGIHHSVAERLSGADFDGDTVLVIPNNAGKVKSAAPLEGLRGFNPQKYKIPEGSNIPKIKPENMQRQMGDVSNLITDMTIKGASTSELARAVRHSMVVIDSEKHNLNYKQSARDNGIASLKEKYQGSPRAGAATLISRKKTEVRVPERKQGHRIDPVTGKKIVSETGKSFVGRNGEVVVKTSKINLLAETDNAHSLSSGTTMEKIYADHSNQMKALANLARKNLVHTPNIPDSPSAKKVYSKQVSTLNAKLNEALRNAPLERQAQVVANTIVTAKRQANPEMDKADLKKIKGQALAAARVRVGAKKAQIQIEPDEWDAIQAGAISNNKLTQILNHANIDQVKELATPRHNTVMTTIKQARAKSMLASGYTQAEVADALGVPLSTLKSNLATT